MFVEKCLFIYYCDTVLKKYIYFIVCYKLQLIILAIPFKAGYEKVLTGGPY